MPAGFQAINDSGKFQVDGSFINLALDRKGTLTTSQYTNGSTTNTRPTRASLQLFDGEILAFACTSPCAVGSKIGNTVFLYANDLAGATIEYWVFKPGYVQGGFGLQVFDENSRITFDATWRLFDVRRLLSGYGSFSLEPGRKYAAVHSQIHTSVTYRRIVNGVPPNSFLSFIRTCSFSSAAISGAQVSTQLSLVDTWGTQPQPGGGGASYSNNFDNGVTPTFLIIDVTNY